MNGRLSFRDGSLDAPVADGMNLTHLDSLRSSEEGPEALYADIERRRLIRRRVNEIMKGFNSRERFIVARRLMTDEPMTLEKIGRRFSISRERVRQIEGGVLGKLRDELRGSELDYAA
jgi:RNA polymerase sigma-32 factor